MKEAFDQIDRLFHMHGEPTGVPSGFRDIDEMTTGFQPGNFVIIAARPGMGKTSFALNMAVSAARERTGEPIAFFSLEMSNNELIQRLISSEARISMNDMRRGNIRTHQWDEIRTLDGLAQRTADLSRRYRRAVGERSAQPLPPPARRSTALGAIFIDYLQLMRPGTLARNANRNEELSDICRTLKVTAKEFEVPIIALAQLNRGVETRQDKRPMLADLRDSGSLEQEADIVAFLYRDGYYNPESTPEPDVTEFIIAKHRNGPTGTVKLRFQEEFTLFLPYGDESHFPPPN